MKYCTNCGAPLQEHVNFCPACGTAQAVSVVPVQTNNPSALATLCVLTIIGSVLGIIRGLFYEILSSVTDAPGSSFYMLGFVSIIANAGTLTGAILMLQRKLSGYTLYIICQVIGIAVIIFRTLQFNVLTDLDNSMINTFTGFIAASFIIPSVVFMVLYTTLVKKYLVK